MARINITTDEGEVMDILQAGRDFDTLAVIFDKGLARGSLVSDIVSALRQAHVRETGNTLSAPETGRPPSIQRAIDEARGATPPSRETDYMADGPGNRQG